MISVTAKELRVSISSILETVRKGQEVVVTYRGKSVALLKPIDKEEKSFQPIGFGLWKDRQDLADTRGWVDKGRKERFRK